MGKRKFNPKSLFLEQTLTLLKNKPNHITYKLIEEETKLSICWLDSLVNKTELDPGVRKIETLYNYLSDKPFSFNNEIKEYETDIDEY